LPILDGPTESPRGAVLSRITARRCGQEGGGFLDSQIGPLCREHPVGVLEAVASGPQA